MQLLFLTALFTIFHYCSFSIIRYSSNYPRLLPKWGALLQATSFLVHYIVDWLFCFLYIGLGCYIGRLFRQIFHVRTALISDPLGILIVTLVCNSLFYLIAFFTNSSNCFVLAFMEEFSLILISDIVVLVANFYIGTFVIWLLKIQINFQT